MFKITSNAHTLTGDGVALAYRHGVPLEDMEFYQFHPTGIVGPGHPPVRGGARRGRLPAQQGRRAVHGALRARRSWSSPRATWSAGRSTSRSATAAASSGKDYVHLDLTPPGQGGHRGEAARHHRVRARLPGLEPITQPVPIQPTAHYAMGGIPTDVAGARRPRRADTRRARPLRGRRVRLRVASTGPTAWAPTRSSTSSSSASAPGSSMAELLPRRQGLPEVPRTTPRSRCAAEIEALRARRDGESPVAHPRGARRP